MEPKLLTIKNESSHSFIIRNDSQPQNNNHWHYHPEVELVHIRKGKGIQVVGNHINRFEDGNMVLIGSGLSHFWRFDEKHLQNINCYPQTDVGVLHFKENFWGDDFLNLPENNSIRALLLKAKGGLEIFGNTRFRIGSLMEEAGELLGAERIIVLLEILTIISTSNEFKILTSIGYGMPNTLALEDYRIQAIYNFSLRHFKRKIELVEIAEVANLCPHYFCRFFKSNTGITYTCFLNELRIGHACHLLMKNRTNIQMVAIESGYFNFAYFYRCFKKIIGMSPLKYQQEYFKKSLTYN